jgi:hypothetical protein
LIGSVRIRSLVLRFCNSEISSCFDCWTPFHSNLDLESRLISSLKAINCSCDIKMLSLFFLSLSLFFFFFFVFVCLVGEIVRPCVFSTVQFIHSVPALKALKKWTLNVKRSNETTKRWTLKCDDKFLRLRMGQIVRQTSD